MEAHGGNISAGNNDNDEHGVGGATFSITIPLFSN
jgi:signal transduction histidine kinase